MEVEVSRMTRRRWKKWVWEWERKEVVWGVERKMKWVRWEDGEERELRK